MKRYLAYTGLAGLLLTLMPGCDLEETPYSSIFTEQFYKTGQDAEAAITAMQAHLTSALAGTLACLQAGMAVPSARIPGYLTSA